MKLLKRKILFTLASEIDFFSRTESFNYKPYYFLYWRLAGYQESSIRNAVLQLVESGEIDKIMRNSTSLFRLTSQGRDRLLSFFPISIGQKRVWDRRWRIAIVSSSQGSSLAKDNPSRKIRKLRKGLRKLGFKKLSRGVYLTPLPVSERLKEFLFQDNLTPHLGGVIESRRLVIGDDKQLAKQIWPLNKLGQAYNQSISRIERLLVVLRKQKRLLDKEKKQFSLILDNIFSLLAADPGLPKKLLPNDWPLDLARERFLKLAEAVKFLENDKNHIDIL